MLICSFYVKGDLQMTSIKNTYHIGYNDADYKINKTITVDGKSRSVWVCPYYKRWNNMLRRCYYLDKVGTNPTYKDCIVCEDWLAFSNFKAWMETQDWEGKQLDKDLLVEGNKVYSPETCIFVTGQVNQLTVLTNSIRGEHPVGVAAIKGRTYYQSYINYRGKRKTLGTFKTTTEAHKAWQKAKLSIIEEFINEAQCKKTRKGLERIEGKLRYHIENGIETTSL